MLSSVDASWKIVLTIVAAVGVLALSGCEPPAPRKVLVVGDSLSVESQDAIRERIPGARVLARTGSAPCSMIDEAVSVAKGYDVVVLAFSGNGSFLAPCMRGNDGQRLGVAYENSYQRYADRIGRGKIRMAMAPVWGGDGHGTSTLARLAAYNWSNRNGVPVVDAASELGWWKFLAGDFRKPGELGVGDSTFVGLRAADQVHLCQAPGYRLGFSGPACPKNSSAGVSRFADGIAESARS